jgi:hypothetical protein
MTDPDAIPLLRSMLRRGYRFGTDDAGRLRVAPPPDAVARMDMQTDYWALLGLVEDAKRAHASLQRRAERERRLALEPGTVRVAELLRDAIGACLLPE